MSRLRRLSRNSCTKHRRQSTLCNWRRRHDASTQRQHYRWHAGKQDKCERTVSYFARRDDPAAHHGLFSKGERVIVAQGTRKGHKATPMSVTPGNWPHDTTRTRVHILARNISRQQRNRWWLRRLLELTWLQRATDYSNRLVQHDNFWQHYWSGEL